VPSSGPSLKARFAAAIALTIGFYALALVMAGALLAAAILPWVLGDGFNLFIMITCFVLASPSSSPSSRAGCASRRPASASPRRTSRA
jgi:hypothetical protein